MGYSVYQGSHCSPYVLLYVLTYATMLCRNMQKAQYLDFISSEKVCVFATSSSEWYITRRANMFTQQTYSLISESNAKNSSFYAWYKATSSLVKHSLKAWINKVFVEKYSIDTDAKTKKYLHKRVIFDNKKSTQTPFFQIKDIRNICTFSMSKRKASDYQIKIFLVRPNYSMAKLQWAK